MLPEGRIRVQEGFAAGAPFGLIQEESGAGCAAKDLGSIVEPPCSSWNSLASVAMAGASARAAVSVLVLDLLASDAFDLIGVAL